MCLFKNTFLLFFVATDVLKVTVPTASCVAKFFFKEFLGDIELLSREVLFVDLFLRSAPKNLSTVKI